MIDFSNGALIKLKKVSNDNVGDNLINLLLDNENVISTYKGIRDYVVFTNLRVIAVNAQGLTGKKQDYTSMPYSKITTFSVETAGVLDLDGELEMYFAGVGLVKFEFTGGTDIIQIGKLISSYVL